ncbi:leucine carboxyl methyltransferase superfamily [Saccharata proteae CBS 121410]|uniref:Leucine carboxyl methyltransferase 1 n=1 Tax=Saccharata proteae CBS 121410 TaxID=1314787 RepID=A0A9P4HLF7_9PEZI|nr:leucine carboxyl methyltransferase superfamily [Saccharata proteae CBS 121410]
MAAPQIPNLNTLRQGRGGGLRGRGRGLRDPHGSESLESRDEKQDKIVQNTDQDASGSRMSAVALQYLDDPFARPFITEQIPRRYPIINRGTYVRTTAIDRLVDAFLATDPERPKQIVSLGAGSDTRFFRIMARSPRLQLSYHELDFPTNTSSKISTIQRTPALIDAIKSSLHEPSSLAISQDATALHSPTYSIHPLDLRAFANTDPSTPLPSLPFISPTTPTLVLSECCLIYLSPNHADAILANLTTRLIPQPTPLSLVVYEPIRPHDPFGRVMISNLAARGIVLQTLKKYSSLYRQRERLRRAGFAGGQAAADVNWLWEQWVPEGEKERVGSLEMLDEVEEWVLLARHYCVVWGWRGEVFGKAWGEVKGWEGVDDEEMG